MNHYISSLHFWSMHVWPLRTGGKREVRNYELAFSYFMTRNLTVSDAVTEAIKQVRPDKVRENGSLKLSKSALSELELRVKNML
jgi:hypothetical protein